MSTSTTSVASAAGVRPPALRRAGRGAPLLSLALGAVLLAGCGNTPTAARPVVRPSELADAGNRPCPEVLPTGDDPSGHGFGSEQPAAERPFLLEPQQAWVCRYWVVDGGTTANGGATYEWERTGQAEPVAARDVPALEAALDDLTPADSRRACTDELGARWLVVYSHDGDLTGVVVDGYGCRDVRLTDDPHATPPGADDQHGTVAGVLDGGAAVLDAVGVDRSD